MTWEQFFEWLMDREARTVHTDPRDPGGQTAWGIARKFHPGWPGWALVDQGSSSGPQFEALVRAFYRDLLAPYWDRLPAMLREAVCDAVVNMGPGRPGDNARGAVELLQHAINRLAGVNLVTEDGVLGPKTMGAVKRMDPAALAMTVCALRMGEYVARARRNPEKRVFLAGWLSRVHLLMETI